MPENRRSTCHCINLRRVSGRVTDYYNRVLKPCGLTVNQFSLLRNLEQAGSSSAAALAARMGLERSTLARNLRPLRENGFIEDVAASGRRDRELRLTARGAAALAAGNPLWEAAQHGMLELLGGEKLDIFHEVLHKLRKL